MLFNKNELHENNNNYKPTKPMLYKPSLNTHVYGPDLKTIKRGFRVPSFSTAIVFSSSASADDDVASYNGSRQFLPQL